MTFRRQSTAVDNLPTPNPTVAIAKLVRLTLMRSGFHLQSIEDLGTSARLVVRKGSRREPGDLHGVDTLQEFNITVSETPKGQVTR